MEVHPMTNAVLPPPPADYVRPEWCALAEGQAWRELGLSDYGDGLRAKWVAEGWRDASRRQLWEYESPDGGSRDRAVYPETAVRVHVRWQYPRTRYGDLGGEATVDLDGRDPGEAVWAVVADGLRPHVGDAYLPILLALLRRETTLAQAQAQARSDPASPWYLPPAVWAERDAQARRERAMRARRRWRDTHPQVYAALRTATGICPPPTQDEVCDVVTGAAPAGARVVPATFVLLPEMRHQTTCTLLGRHVTIGERQILGSLLVHSWGTDLPWPVVRARRWRWASGRIALRLDFAVESA
jgi:hypothetical protein